MKNRINKIASKLFAVIVLTTALNGTVFAQSSLMEKADERRVQVTEQIRRPVDRNREKWTVKKGFESKRILFPTVSDKR